MESILRKFGKIDILINNAGYGLMAPSINQTEEKILHQFKTKVYAPVTLTQK